MDRPEGVPYRLHLLAYDLDKEDLYDRTRTAFLMRAAVLTELALQGKLGEVEGTVKVATPDMTGDQALDETLLQVGADRRTWKSWVRCDYKETLEAAERQLVAQGLITLHAKKVLGVITKTQVEVTNTVLEKELQRQARDTLHGVLAADQVDPADAVLAALAAAGSVRSVVSRKDRHTYKGQVEALTVRVGEIAPGLEKAVRAISMTMIAAQGGLGGSRTLRRRRPRPRRVRRPLPARGHRGVDLFDDIGGFTVEITERCGDELAGLLLRRQHSFLGPDRQQPAEDRNLPQRLGPEYGHHHGH